MPAIIGLDPALAKNGVCRHNGETFTSRGEDATRVKTDTRLDRLYRDVEQVVLADEVQLAIIEDLPINARGAGLTGQAQGVVRSIMQKHSIPYVTVVASTLKKFATGSGKSDKVQMWQALPLDLQAAIPVERDDEVDAWWLWTMGHSFWKGEEVPTAVKWEGWKR